MKKLCKSCNNTGIVKNGKRKGVQRFLCKSCGYVFEHRNNKNKQNLNFEKIFEYFVRDDLKYRQMSQTFDKSIVYIQSMLDKAPFKKTIFPIINQLKLYY